MNIPTEFLLSGAIFLFVVLVIEAVYLMSATAQSSRENANRRMARRRRVNTATASNLRRAQRKRGIGSLDRMITQAGLTMSAGKFLLIMVVLSVTFTAASIFFIIGTFGNAPRLVTLLPHAAIGLAIGVGLPLLVVSIKRQRRVKKFQEQLPDALDAIVRGLKAGHPIASALQLVSDEMADPMGTEFAMVIDEMTYGSDLQQALEKMAQRMSVEDFEYFVVAVNIQHESGGNLAEILDGLSRVIRGRFRLFKKVRALSAEGRMSAMLLAILPFATAGVIFTVNSSYYIDASDDPLFWPGFGLVGVMMVAGIITMYRMVNFRV